MILRSGCDRTTDQWWYIIVYSGFGSPAPGDMGTGCWADGRNLRATDCARAMSVGCETTFRRILFGHQADNKDRRPLIYFFSTWTNHHSVVFSLPYDCFPEPDVDETDDTIARRWSGLIAPKIGKGTLKFVINITTNDKSRRGGI